MDFPETRWSIEKGLGEGPAAQSWKPTRSQIADLLHALEPTGIGKEKEFALEVLGSSARCLNSSDLALLKTLARNLDEHPFVHTACFLALGLAQLNIEKAIQRYHEAVAVLDAMRPVHMDERVWRFPTRSLMGAVSLTIREYLVLPDCWIVVAKTRIQGLIAPANLDLGNIPSHTAWI
ncbi:hypothetical protein HDU98_007209 [Podochytrium sp. JEL0797]|nr:hypothetical protein HDU98_007209 [Podochytrium sp. JEL0797]